MLARYSDTSDAGYPQDAWVPAEFGEPRTLRATRTVHIRLERGLAYPNGVMGCLTVRVPEPLTLAEQRALGEEVMSFHAGPGHQGPRLEYRLAGSEDWTEAVPWGHGGSRGLWTLGYWVPLDPEDREDLQLEFGWPGKAVIERIDYPSQEWVAARELAEYAWKDTREEE